MNCTSIVIQRNFENNRKKMENTAWHCQKSIEDKFCEMCNIHVSTGILKNKSYEKSVQGEERETCMSCLISRYIFPMMRKKSLSEWEGTNAKNIEFAYIKSDNICEFCKSTRIESSVIVSY